MGGDPGRQGLLKLMLRLPALRRDLLRLWPGSVPLRALCEAYHDATLTRERLSVDAGAHEDPLLGEYETICIELEDEISALCRAGR